MRRLHPNLHLANIDYAKNFDLLPPSIPQIHLNGREESTRVQLQKQRLREQHAVVVSQLPGFKTSAAFFASLRTNLRLNASPPPSPMSTPPSMQASTGTLPPPSPLSTAAEPGMDPGDAAAPEDPLTGVPELTTYMATEEEDKIAAMKLVADSIAQMRQTANNSLIFHPVNLAVMTAVLALIIRFMINKRYDPFVVGTTCTGLIVTTLISIRYLTQDYLSAAETYIGWDWLGDADIIVTKFGDEIMGTVIVDWISGESRQKRKKAWRGEIKGWSVRLRYRHKGVGSALLEEAVKESKKKGAESIEFADVHANSKRILPQFYNGKFERQEKQARDMLQDLLEASPTRTRRKRGGSS